MDDKTYYEPDELPILTDRETGEEYQLNLITGERMYLSEENE